MSNDCQNQQLVYAVKNDEQAKEKQKATERKNIQSKGLNTAHTEKQNIKRQKIQPTSQAKQADKVTKRNAYMKQLMQKKREDPGFKENEKKEETNQKHLCMCQKTVIETLPLIMQQQKN